eukprot:jgi/Botrbrau1/3676/Bobra.0008s0007.1
MAIPVVADKTHDKRRDDYALHVAELQRIILSWNFWHVGRCYQQGIPTVEGLKKVPEKFHNVEQYKHVFERLVLEECAAIMINSEKGNAQSCNAAILSATESDGFTQARLFLERGRGAFAENDLLLLTGEKEESQAEEEQMERHALAWLQGREGDEVLSIKLSSLQSDSSDAHEHHRLSGDTNESWRRERCQTIRSIMVENSIWGVQRLANMSTITREWVAVHLVQKLPFLRLLLDPTLSRQYVPSSSHSVLHVPALMKGVLASEYNESQLRAIEAGLDGSPLVLIQGPPGTGKTRTILGLLSIILHAAPPGVAALTDVGTGSTLEPPDSVARSQLWQKAAPWSGGAVNPRAVKCTCSGIDVEEDGFGLMKRRQSVQISGASGPKPHVLVCAPSNAALDEIVARILRYGLLDRQGRRYTPNVVRVGLNVHHSVESVSLESAVAARLKNSAESYAGTSIRVTQDKARMAVLEAADIVCSTLSFSGSSTFARMSRGFDVVVIDEAAQAVEPSTLVPLVAGVRQVYLVGDPVQLPATVISETAVAHNYNVSLFKRLQENKYPVQMLNMQYRMHPRISAFPSSTFYKGQLMDGERVEDATARSWHSSTCLGPLAFYDVRGKEEVDPVTASLYNETEAELVIYLFAELTDRFEELRNSGQIAVISPYKAQVDLLRRNFAAGLGEDRARAIDINTIDGFQGREKDIVIFSPVRTRRGGGIGFVADERRINVGLTRARSSLLLVGHAPVLCQNHRWHAFVEHCARTGCMYRAAYPLGDFLDEAIAGKVRPESWETVAEMAEMPAQSEDIADG